MGKGELREKRGWYDFCFRAFFKERKKNITLLQRGKYKKKNIYAVEIYVSARLAK